LNRRKTALTIRVVAVAVLLAFNVARVAAKTGISAIGLAEDPFFFVPEHPEEDGGNIPARVEPELWKLANAERLSAGLPPLVWDEQLADAARAKTGDMVRRGYFSLDSPGVGAADDWLRRFGIRFRAAAMDVACNRSAEEAFRMLAMSPVYRRHLLDPAFTRTGAGAAAGGPCGGMFAQLFAD